METVKNWHNYEKLSFEEEKGLIRLWKIDGNKDAREKVILHNQHVCYSVARRLTSDYNKINDLMNEGIFGLMEAIEKYDDSKNVKFSSYARWWVMTYIHKHMHVISVVINIPAKAYMDARSHKNLNKDLIPWDAKQASIGEIALDSPMNSDNDILWVDTLIDGSISPEEICIENDTESNFVSILDKILKDILTPREKYIIEQRFLIETTRTLLEISKDMKLSRERVRQIEKSAISKIQEKIPDKKVFKKMFQK